MSNQDGRVTLVYKQHIILSAWTLWQMRQVAFQHLPLSWFFKSCMHMKTVGTVLFSDLSLKFFNLLYTRKFWNCWDIITELRYLCLFFRVERPRKNWLWNNICFSLIYCTSHITINFIFRLNIKLRFKQTTYGHYGHVI